MPFIRTPRGHKNQFTKAKLSSLISNVYIEVYGNAIIEKREEIQKLCLNIWRELKNLFGENENDEWQGEAIKSVIEEHLKKLETFEIHETFLELNFSEFYKKGKTKKLKERTWHGFEAKPEKKYREEPQEMADPVWAIRFVEEDFNYLHKKNYLKENDESEQVSNPKKHDNNFSNTLSTLGEETAYKRKTHKHQFKKILEIKRSQWIKFWEEITNEKLPLHKFKNTILKNNERQTKTLKQWEEFWQDLIDEVIPIEPKLYDLRRIIIERKKRALISSSHWIAETNIFPSEIFLLNNTKKGMEAYLSLSCEYLKNQFKSAYNDIIWSEIKNAIQPERDKNVNWQAWLHLERADCLKEVKCLLQDTLYNDKKINLDKKAIELPQWAWMRVSIALSLCDEHIKQDKEKITNKAIHFYDQISRMNLIPSAAIVREAGKKHPRFLEDYTWSVQDDFKEIQKVIYSAAVNTMWTGTSASDWSYVRSKNAPVKKGIRQSTGVNDFLKTINAHLKSQGRDGEDRPVTVLLPVWHMDVKDFITLRSKEQGKRLQPVLKISDLFMQRVAEGGEWHFFDPYIYPEVLNGDKGYLEAEKNITKKKNVYPNASKTIKAEKFWKQILTCLRTGSPFITFNDNDRCFSISEDLDILNGLDGVGVFPLMKQSHHKNSSKIQWPVMTINLSNMINDDGEPELNKLKDTLELAFWGFESIYCASQKNLSDETKNLRPVCLGTVGFYEAIQKSLSNVKENDQNKNSWIYQLSETLSTLTTVIDQTFCQKKGSAKLWDYNKTQNDFLLRPFHPQKAYERFKQQRHGGVGMYALKANMDDVFDHIKSHRFSVRTVWAPFKQASIWSGVSPGGFGSLFPIQWVMDENEKYRITPTGFFLSKIKNEKITDEEKNILKYPNSVSKWPKYIQELSYPKQEEWKNIFYQASIVRPWIDQGVSVTLPENLTVEELNILIKQAWWVGVNNVRFENPLKKPKQIT